MRNIGKALDKFDLTQEERDNSLFINDVMQAARARNIDHLRAIFLCGALARVAAQLEAKLTGKPVEQLRTELREHFVLGMDCQVGDIEQGVSTDDVFR